MSDIHGQFMALRPAGGFQMIMADPPWTFRNFSAKGHAKGAQAHYACMTLDEIAALPVADLADPRGCLLWLWATNPMLPQAVDTLRAWGFTFKTSGHWAKWNAKTGKQGFGTGYVLRGAGEPFLIGSIGKPRASRSVRSVVMAPTSGHSRKPAAAFDAAERLMPEARRVELFSRETRDGWAAWGHEAGKFDPLPDGGRDVGDDHQPGRDGGLRVGLSGVQAAHDGGREVGGPAPAGVVAEEGA